MIESDPNEYVNLWDNPEFLAVKQKLLLEFVQAKMETEQIPMPRIAGA